jgi:hypothetical protein
MLRIDGVLVLRQVYGGDESHVLLFRFWTNIIYFIWPEKINVISLDIFIEQCVEMLVIWVVLSKENSSLMQIWKNHQPFWLQLLIIFRNVSFTSGSYA